MRRLIRCFLKGMASLNLFPVYEYPEILSDEKAIYEAWKVVGDALRDAMEKVEKDG